MPDYEFQYVMIMMDYHCDQCDYENSSELINQHYYEIPGAVELPVITSLAWCRSRASVVLVELLKDVAWFQEHGSLPPLIHAASIFCQRRIGPPRCLACGGQDFILVEDVPDHGPFLRHPGCDGTLVCTSAVKFVEVFGTGYGYDIEGNRLKPAT